MAVVNWGKLFRAWWNSAKKCRGHLPCRKKGDIVANKDYRNSLKISHISQNIFIREFSHEWGSSATYLPACIKFVCLSLFFWEMVICWIKISDLWVMLQLLWGILSTFSAVPFCHHQLNYLIPITDIADESSIALQKHSNIFKEE